MVYPSPGPSRVDTPARRCPGPSYSPPPRGPVLCSPLPGPPPPQQGRTPPDRHDDCHLRRTERTLPLPTPRELEVPCSTPDYYPFPLRLSPHPFMGLGKFMASRIH